MAGPFGSTSDTTTVVSPLSGFGLSLPPDMANPNPSLESCHYERMTCFKQGRMGQQVHEAATKTTTRNARESVRGERACVGDPVKR